LSIQAHTLEHLINHTYWPHSKLHALAMPSPQCCACLTGALSACRYDTRLTEKGKLGAMSAAARVRKLRPAPEVRTAGRCTAAQRHRQYRLCSSAALCCDHVALTLSGGSLCWAAYVHYVVLGCVRPLCCVGLRTSITCCVGLRTSITCCVGLRTSITCCVGLRTSITVPHEMASCLGECGAITRTMCAVLAAAHAAGLTLSTLCCFSCCCSCWWCRRSRVRCRQPRSRLASSRAALW
jgi:hypothetical protein